MLQPAIFGPLDKFGGSKSNIVNMEVDNLIGSTVKLSFSPQ